MKNLLVLSLAAVFLAGCETTGDPHQGGIFWSENKARQRLYEKREKLRDIESDTERAQRNKGQIDDEG